MAASSLPPFDRVNSSRALSSPNLATITAMSRDRLRPAEQAFEHIIGISPALESVLSDARRVASTGSAVLLLGETGTGKELMARAIHNMSTRRDRPFVKLNCAAIPFNLLESELFGHEPGAFTGAVARRLGRFEMADSGTLFLDEIGDLPLALQPKLLRVLQEQEFERLGSCHTHRVNVRLVAATHRDLSQMVIRNEFRSDLFYRLNVFPVLIPPLRDRPDDIPRLVEHFAEVFSRRMGKPIQQISRPTMDALCAYSWPGNVRELQNLVERAVIRSDNGILANPFSPSHASPLPSHTAERDDLQAGVGHHCRHKSEDSLEEVKRQHILGVLARTGWVINGSRGAASILHLHPNTLRSLMERLGIRRESTASANSSQSAA